MDFLVYLFDMLISLVPLPYRERYGTDFDLYPAAMASAVTEYALSVVVLFVSYVHAMNESLLRVGGAAMAQGREDVLAAGPVIYGSGAALAGAFLLRPLSLLLVYFALEGLVRLLGATVSHQVVGTLPLYVAARGWERLKGLTHRTIDSMTR